MEPFTTLTGVAAPLAMGPGLPMLAPRFVASRMLLCTSSNSVSRAMSLRLR